MDEVLVEYNGRAVPKHGFRVFIYGKEGQSKLVNSWEEFMAHMNTKEWFSSPEEMQAHQELESFQKESEIKTEESKPRGRKKASE